MPPDGYLRGLRDICDRYGIVLIFDEVMSGFGRTGEWFGSQHYRLEPDILTMAKGLSSGYQPISAVSLGPRMGKAIADAEEELVHGYTYPFYVFTALHLSVKARYSLKKMIIFILAGTLPVASFIAERRAVKEHM